MRKFIICALLASAASFMSAQRIWHDPMSDTKNPYLSGRAWNTETYGYCRIPDRFKASLPSNVWALSRNSAGITVRFRTDSENIQIRYVNQSNHPGYRNMTPLNHSGVDLYAYEDDGTPHWIGNHMKWNFGDKDGDTTTITYQDIVLPEKYREKGMEFELYLPPYNTVKSLQIGTFKDSHFTFIREKDEKPVVIYGSSIVHGASPSRPGLMWASIVKREMGLPLVNLGFSGSALMEPAVFDMIADIDARMFIIDPIPNSHSIKELVTSRAIDGIRRLRKSSSAPILMMENHPIPDSIMCRKHYESYRLANVEFRKAYDALIKEGIKDLYYMSSQEIPFTEESMIEGIHPNDLGNREYADAVEKKIRMILKIK